MDRRLELYLGFRLELFSGSLDVFMLLIHSNRISQITPKGSCTKFNVYKERKSLTNFATLLLKKTQNKNYGSDKSLADLSE